VAPVKVSFVSDIHGNIDGLARIAEHAEQLVVLGDLLDYVDYHEFGNGILGQVFGAEKVGHFASLRASGNFGALHDYNRRLWDSVDDAAGVLADVVDTRYREVLAAVGTGALLILGNVDVAAAWDEAVGAELPNRDGQVVELAGRRFGFVAGGSTRPGTQWRAPDSIWRPMVRPAAEYRAVADSLGPVDVLCSHVPPNLPLLRYDRIPGRLEMYGPGLLEVIDRCQPQLAVFGHVHQPLAQRTRRGRTECVNVGHFQRFPTAFEVEFD
jgi:Icc-related predicted phosphoesterase